MGRTKQTARKSKGGRAPRKSHASKGSKIPNYDSMTVVELKKLIPSDKIVSSRPGKPPLKADIIESIKNQYRLSNEDTSPKKESKSKETKSESSSSKSSGSGRGKSDKGCIGKQKKSTKKESKSKESGSRESKEKKSKEGMVIMIWTKEDYESYLDLGGQSNTYYSNTPYVRSSTDTDELLDSIHAQLKIFRHHLKIHGVKTEYKDEDLERVIMNPSTKTYFNDALYYYEVISAIRV